MSITTYDPLVSISTRAVAHLGQADSVAVLPGQQPLREDQSGRTGVDGTGHRGPDVPINSIHALFVYFNSLLSLLSLVKTEKTLN